MIPPSALTAAENNAMQAEMMEEILKLRSGQIWLPVDGQMALTVHTVEDGFVHASGSVLDRCVSVFLPESTFRQFFPTLMYQPPLRRK